MENKFDLRLVIGLFFTIIGLLIVGYGSITLDHPGATINIVSGSLFMLFGFAMFYSSLRKFI